MGRTKLPRRSVEELRLLPAEPRASIVPSRARAGPEFCCPSKSSHPTVRPNLTVLRLPVASVSPPPLEAASGPILAAPDCRNKLPSWARVGDKDMLLVPASAAGITACCNGGENCEGGAVLSGDEADMTGDRLRGRRRKLRLALCRRWKMLLCRPTPDSSSELLSLITGCCCCCCWPDPVPTSACDASPTLAGIVCRPLCRACLAPGPPSSSKLEGSAVGIDVRVSQDPAPAVRARRVRWLPSPPGPLLEGSAASVAP